MQNWTHDWHPEQAQYPLTYWPSPFREGCIAPAVSPRWTLALVHPDHDTAGSLFGMQDCPYDGLS